jgi:hypothetical protein
VTQSTVDDTGITDVLGQAREQVLERGEGLTQDQILAVLQLPDDQLEELLALAHEVRMRWCGPEVEVEGIISLQTGGCPEDCHFCSQSGLFASPVRSAWLDIPSLVEAAKQTAKSGATEFCIVAAVRGPDEKLLAQVAAGIEAIRNEVDIQIACSLGMLTQEQVDRLAGMGVHRYNHNLETARSFFTNVVTTWSKCERAVSRLWLYRCTPRATSWSTWGWLSMPSEQAIWMSTSARIARTPSATWAISRSSGPRTAATMQNSVAPVRAVCLAASTRLGTSSQAERTGEEN